MRFVPLELAGAYVIELETASDERGRFARTFSTEDFRSHGVDMVVTQSGSSFSAKRGTLRGLHYQRAPHAEAKLIRCLRGAIHDVAVDLRPDSPTYLRSIGLELTAGDLREVYLPEGLAHGLLTLEDDTEVVYLMTGRYVPEAATGVRWNDPAFAIDWPNDPVVMSQRDREWPLIQQ